MYDKMRTHDKKMATDLVDALLASQCTVSVDDGGDWPAIEASRDRSAILDAVGNTDYDIIVADALGKHGTFVLVYGNNPGETINDYTANDFCQSIVDKVEALNPMQEG